jgi:hypothetical protein
MPPETEGLDDRDVQLVTLATRRAVRELLDGFKRSTVVWAVLIGVVVGGAFGAGITYWLGHENSDAIREQARQSAHREALTACEAQSQARPQGNARAFDEVAVLELFQDALKHPAEPRTPAVERFVAREFRKINKELRYWRRFTKRTDGKNELPAKLTEYGQLRSALRPVPVLDCAHLLNG